MKVRCERNCIQNVDGYCTGSELGVSTDGTCEDFVERVKFEVVRDDNRTNEGREHTWKHVLRNFFLMAVFIVLAMIAVWIIISDDNINKASVDTVNETVTEIYLPVEKIDENDPDDPKFQIMNRSGRVILLNGKAYQDAECIKLVSSKEMYVDGQKVYGIAKKDLDLPEGRYSRI